MIRSSRNLPSQACRRGFSLMEVLVLLPLIAATLTVIFQISARAVRLESHAIGHLSADARRDDLVRRIREDAALARTAELAQSDGSTTLVLNDVRPSSQPAPADTGDRTIQYRITGPQVARIERQADESTTVYRWDLPSMDIGLQLESVADAPRLIWISFVETPLQGLEAASPQPLAAAATIGRGGVR